MKGLFTKLGMGNETYKGMANCPLFFSHLEGSLTDHEESESRRRDISQNNTTAAKFRHKKEQGQFWIFLIELFLSSSARAFCEWSQLEARAIGLNDVVSL